MPYEEAQPRVATTEAGLEILVISVWLLDTQEKVSISR
jgi:hypothetical protein